jgi:hypothetical protein
MPTLRATETPTTELSKWYKRAMTACDPFLFPESRYRTLWMDDDLARSLESARKWLRDNPCPDSSIGFHVQAMLDAYAHMTTASVARVEELREVIESHGKEVDRRRASRS